MTDRTRRIAAWLLVVAAFTFVLNGQQDTNQRSLQIAAESRRVARKAQRAIDVLEKQSYKDCLGTNEARELLRSLARDLVSDDGVIDASDERTLELVALRLKPKDCKR